MVMRDGRGFLPFVVKGHIGFVMRNNLRNSYHGEEQISIDKENIKR